MATPTTIETLIDLALTESDMAAKRLGSAVRTSEESQEKSTLLVNYRQEYVEKLHVTLAAGLGMQQHKNYQDFIRGLDRAILQQSHICLMDQVRVQEQLKLWQRSEQKRLSYLTLSNRTTIMAKKLDDKREQKNADEFAARKYSAQR